MRTRGYLADQCIRQSHYRGLINCQHTEITQWRFLTRLLTHQVKVNTVIHQIVFARLHISGRAKVHAVLTADVLDLVIGAGQADDARVEFLQVCAQHLGCITSGIAGDENWHEDFVVLGGFLDFLDDGGHFVQLVGANIRAMSEAEVDLQRNRLATSPIIRLHFGLSFQLTKLYFPFRSSAVNSFPSRSFNTNGPPTLGRPTPLLISAMRFRSKRAFSTRK